MPGEVSTRRPARTGPALLMLLIVTAGLFTMHTLGHFSMPATTMPMSHTAAPMDPHPQDQASMGMNDAPAVSRAAMPAQPRMPMGSVVACVAILCGLIVFAIAAALSRRVRLYGLALLLASRRVIDAVRGPPRVLIGLCLADVSVARN